MDKPVLGAGTLWAVSEGSDANRAVIEHLKTPLANGIWMAQSGFLTSHNGVNTEAYADETLKKMGQILLDTITFHFDGSDLMLGAVGAGWSVHWVGFTRTGKAPPYHGANPIQLQVIHEFVFAFPNAQLDSGAPC